MLLHNQFDDLLAIVGLAFNKRYPNSGVRMHGTASRLDEMVAPADFPLPVVKLHPSDAPAFISPSGAARIPRTEIVQASVNGGVSTMPDESADAVSVLNINEGENGCEGEPQK